MTARVVAAWLARRAENVAAALLAVMFSAFVAQIVLRYALNWPTGWTTELTVVCWLWLVLWGAAFVVRERDEIRFDLLSAAVGRRTRIAMAAVAAVAAIALYAGSLPAAWSYVSFMRVERTSYLKIRFDVLYSIYVVFALAIVVRYGAVLANLLRGRDPADGPPASGPGSGL